MKHLHLSELQRTKPKDIPEGEIFCVHNETKRTSPFVTIVGDAKHNEFCFMVKIKGRLFNSELAPENAKREDVKARLRQVRMIKEGGWYDTGETMLDDIKMFRETKYRCAYCGQETTEPKGACICRRVGKVLETT